MIYLVYVKLDVCITAVCIIRLSRKLDHHTTILHLTGLHQGYHLIDLLQPKDPRIDPGKNILSKRKRQTFFRGYTAWGSGANDPV